MTDEQLPTIEDDLELVQRFTAPLLERIAALEAKLAQRVPDGWRYWLESHQWSRFHDDDTEGCCPDCGNWKHEGHSRDCAIAAMLSAAPAAPEQQAPNAQQAEAQEPACRVWNEQVGPGHGTPAFTRYEVQWIGVDPNTWSGDLFTRPQPAQLQALSEEEVIACVKRAELGNGIFWPAGTNEFVAAIQSALAAKNGVTLIPRD